MQSQEKKDGQDKLAPSRRPTGTPDHSVRDYIYGMAHELSLMARWEGDEPLAVLLEAATSRAALKIAPTR